MSSLPEPLSPLINTGATPARTRQQIYQKYQRMMASPLVGGSLRQHCTAALGGHETTGDLVFIELKSDHRQDKRAAELRRETTEVRRHLRQAAAKPKEALRLEQQIGRDGAGGRGHGRGRLSRRDGLDLRGELFERRIKRLMRLGFLSGEGGRDHIVFLSNSQTGDSLRPAGGDVDKLGAGTLEVVVGQWVKWNILHETDCSRG